MTAQNRCRFKKFLILFSLLAQIALPQAVEAGQELAGTTTANFLKIGVNAHAVGLGEAVTGLTHGVSFVGHNPAAVKLNRLQLTGTHTLLYDGISLDEIALGIPFGRRFGFILRGRGIFFEDTEKRDVTGNLLGDFSSSSFAAGAGFYVHTKSLSLGLFGKSIQQKIDVFSASTVAADVGLQYRTPLEGLTLGASLLNVGRPVTFIKQSDDLPSSARAGVGYNGGFFKIGVDAVQYRDRDMFWAAGTELTLFGGLSFRAGYSDNSELKSPFKAGIGFQFSSLQMDYAYNPGDDFGASHRVSLTIR